MVTITIEGSERQIDVLYNKMDDTASYLVRNPQPKEHEHEASLTFDACFTGTLDAIEAALREEALTADNSHHQPTH